MALPVEVYAQANWAAIGILIFTGTLMTIDSKASGMLYRLISKSRISFLLIAFFGIVETVAWILATLLFLVCTVASVIDFKEILDLARGHELRMKYLEHPVLPYCMLLQPIAFFFSIYLMHFGFKVRTGQYLPVNRRGMKRVIPAADDEC
jgi:hypothetical protein